MTTKLTDWPIRGYEFSQVTKPASPVQRLVRGPGRAVPAVHDASAPCPSSRRPFDEPSGGGGGRLWRGGDGGPPWGPATPRSSTRASVRRRRDPGGLSALPLPCCGAGAVCDAAESLRERHSGTGGPCSGITGLQHSHAGTATAAVVLSSEEQLRVLVTLNCSVANMGRRL